MSLRRSALSMLCTDTLGPPRSRLTEEMACSMRKGDLGPFPSDEAIMGQTVGDGA